MKNDHPAVRSLAAVALLSTACAGLLWAGPLDPPPGPVASTGKPLSEIEPRTAINEANTAGDGSSLFIITRPGSYYLTANVRGVAGKHGIRIASSGVTLDLMGFDLLGVPGSLDGLNTTVDGLTNLAVVNGSVRSWGGDGVDLTTFDTSTCHIEGILAADNGFFGIRAGSNATVRNCSVTSNRLSGMFILSTGTVTNCTASNNELDGIVLGNACTITGSSSTSNTLSGISAGAGCTVVACSVVQNDAHGIVVASNCTVKDCSAQANSLNGITTSSGGTIVSCSVGGNGASGISANSGCTIADCTLRANRVDGISCISACIIRGNACESNGSSGNGAGIHARGIDNRIEGNNCTAADRGIDVDVAGNFIVKNTCSGNTVDWVIAANNVVGPILDRRAPASAAINGFSFAGSLGSTDPNANFSY